jgi:hypothetical protein
MNKISDAGLYAAALAVAFVGVLVVGTSLPTLALLTLAVVCPLTMLIMVYGMHAGGPIWRRRGHKHAAHHRFSSSQGSE